ncbi:OB-fold domain-containing protein [Mycobacterium sp. OTB74]|jgi:uncharacterized OB-fold protein|uniref:OB-fold domain-containing protein n=1 Tax=Mycobacterium sp. OTB74 TaxID=1853452 RepID=UPI0024748CD5|nr:OB-fold domain-containing protein [Mycobacterium sp. OTB74]MDH6245329.1 putative OB-fold protein [Mycobacterium sp. OTB74]
MPTVVAIGTYLPCWGTSLRRIAGDDEDAITMAVEAGRAALGSGAGVERVVLVSRNLPLTESSNAAVLLAGLGLDPELEVDERLGGAPATLDAVSSARPRTLIIGVDLEPAGAAALITAEGQQVTGLQVRTAARVARSLPVRTRNDVGTVSDYGDPRLLHERGLIASLEAAWLDTPAAIAGVDHHRTADLCVGDPPALPTFGASSSIFALAGMAENGRTGPLVAVEQASLSGMTVSGGAARVYRQEPVAQAMPAGTQVAGGDIPISLAAYERAFEAKTRWEAGRFTGSDDLDFPPRYRVADDGALATDYEMVPLPRTGSIYTETTVHMPVPGLRTPYSLVIVELDEVGIRALVKVTGAQPGSVGIGDRGRLTLRRVAVRSGVPDYGYMFEPEAAA